MDLVTWIGERFELTNRLGNWAAHGVAPALEGVTAATANWRPAPDQHTIAETVAHLAYHRELVALRLRGEPKDHRPEEDWQAGPPTEDGFAQVRARLDRAHRDVAGALAQLKAEQLLEPLMGSWLSPKVVTRRIDLAVDIATHDLYHAGQIFVLKRFYAATHSHGAQS
ncbi:MAG TPA: DinB family protein [bacterium]|nr:DinB family protein [bacterium]